MINGATVIDDPDLYTPVGDDPYGSYTLKGEGDICYITQNPAASISFDEMYDGELGYDAFLDQEYIPYITKVDVTPDSLTFTVHRVTPTSDVNDIADFFVIRRDTEEDTAAPALTVPEKVYYYADEDVDLLHNTRAYDIKDGDLTDKIKVSGSLDPTRESVITYSVTDAQGNKVEKKASFIPYVVDGRVDSDNLWTYLDDGTLDDIYVNGAHEWAQADFDTTGWKEAKGPFGAINGELGDHHGIIPETLLGQYYPVGSDEEGDNVPNFFFRTCFDVKDPANIERIVLEMTIDDAASIFINGVELTTVGSQLPEGFYSGYCAGTHKGIYIKNGAYYNIVIDDPEVISALNLKESGNIIAVEIYQEGLYSDDILFALHEMTFSHKAVVKTLPFTDVKGAHWYYDSIYNAYNKGLFVGTSEDKFSPNGTMTRAMAWAVLARIAGSSADKGEKLWYSEYQAWAMESGVSDGTYPNQNITCEQLVSMLYRMQNSPEVNASLDSFGDAAKVSPWAKDAMAWAVETELIVGRGDKLAPRDNATRAEACVLLLKYLELK
ncbi:MAG: S-layer homology domain-containing protein [Clostridia bacterium]|nr:S-layer homology domain-containing protein [Clostridia bacterium]